jgi:hypothetical protein
LAARAAQEHPALVHHERRLHKLMLADELREFECTAGAAGALASTPSLSDQLEDASLTGGSDESVVNDSFHDPSQVRALLPNHGQVMWLH